MRIIAKLVCGFVICCNCSFVLAKDANNADYLAKYAVDWGQANAEYADCQSHQSNGNFSPIGQCPPSGTIHLYYAASALLHYSAATLLPKKYANQLKQTDVSINFSYNKKYSQVGVYLQF